MGQLAAHIVVALVSLIVLGGATRVMEAGLACPDWPLCFGTFLPGRQMNIQVFLEWCHRLDAFLVGIALVVQLVLTFIWRAHLPRWLPWASSLLLFLVVLQAGLGALTVLNLLPSGVVTAHLVLALILIAAMSGVTQSLLFPSSLQSPLWWRLMAGGGLIALISQSLLGARMATTWAAQRCLAQAQGCLWLELHRFFAITVAAWLLFFVIISLLAGGWTRSQWPSLLAVFVLVITQVSLGLLTLEFGLKQPALTVSHQLLAALLVALLSALSFRRPQEKEVILPAMTKETFLEPCHG